MNLTNFTLIKISENNKEDLIFLRDLFNSKEDESINYLGNLSNFNDKNAYIVLNNKNERIGYFSNTEPIENNLGLKSSSLYYAISPKYRKMGYATKLLQEVSDYLLEKNDMLVLSIDKTNIPSKIVAEKNSYQIIFEDEDDYIYSKTKQLQKHK